MSLSIEIGGEIHRPAALQFVVKRGRRVRWIYMSRATPLDQIEATLRRVVAELPKEHQP